MSNVTSDFPFFFVKFISVIYLVCSMGGLKVPIVCWIFALGLSLHNKAQFGLVDACY